MNVIKWVVIAVVLSSLSACGVGEFLITRTVNGMQDDMARQLKKYADFTDAQKLQIEQVANDIAISIRQNRLPILANEIQRLASDIERDSQISPELWASMVAFLERPMTVSDDPEVVNSFARLVYALSDDQALKASKVLTKVHTASLKKQRKLTLKKQNAELIKAVKIIFTDLGISRSRAQIKQARLMLAQRQNHIELEHQDDIADYEIFMSLIRDRSQSESEYLSSFMQAWKAAETSPKEQAPHLWEINAQVTLDVLNYLLTDLDFDERATAAKKLNKYARLLRKLSKEKV